MTAQQSLRIALSAGFFRNLGTYWRAYFLGRELVKRGHDVTLFCIAPDSRFRSRQTLSDGVRIIECPNLLNRPFVSHGLGPLDIGRRLNTLWSEPFDVVHGFEYYADVTLPVLLTKRCHHFAYISDWCDWFSKGGEFGGLLRFKTLARLVGQMEDWARRPAQGVTVISRCLERHVRQLGFSTEQVLYLPGGAPVDSIQPLPKDEARTRLNMNPRWRIVGYLASTYVPGMEQFAGPLASLSQKMPELRVLLIGRMDQTLVSLFREHGLGERLILSGFVPREELPWYLAAADVFLIGLTPHTYNEARWPQKLGEYLAAGRPVVASDVGDLANVLLDSGAGEVVNSQSGDILRALARLLNNPSQASAMGHKARQVAEAYLAWEHLATELEAFYWRIMTSI